MKLCVIEGDGIGHEVVPAALRVLRQLIPELEVESAEAGWDRFQLIGRGIARSHRGEMRQGRGRGPLWRLQFSHLIAVEGYSSPIVSLRKRMADLRQPAPDALSCPCRRRA